MILIHLVFLTYKSENMWKILSSFFVNMETLICDVTNHSTCKQCEIKFLQLFITLVVKRLFPSFILSFLLTGHNNFTKTTTSQTIYFKKFIFFINRSQGSRFSAEDEDTDLHYMIYPVYRSIHKLSRIVEIHKRQREVFKLQYR